MKKSASFEFREEFAKDHRAYMEKLVDDEEKRLTSIESKVSSILGQTGLIMSLLTVALPTLLNQTNATQTSSAVSVVMIGLYAFALVLFILSILEAMEVLNIKKYKYQTGSVETIITKHGSLEAFNKEVICDLIDNYEKNRGFNNQKGTHLLQARRYFRNALMVVGALGLLRALTLINWCN